MFSYFTYIKHMRNKHAQNDNTLLRVHSLEFSSCRTIPAYTGTHSVASIRITKGNLQQLRNTEPGQDYEPFVCLFSTGQSNIPVSIRTGETIWLKILKGARPVCNRKKQRSGGGALVRCAEETHDEEHWQPMTILVSQAYVKGMRVSGVIHRAIVRLVR